MNVRCLICTAKSLASKLLPSSMAVGSDVGPFPHGTHACELVLMVKYGMSPLVVLQANLISGAKLLGWEGRWAYSSPAIWPTLLLFPAIRCRYRSSAKRRICDEGGYGLP